MFFPRLPRPKSHPLIAALRALRDEVAHSVRDLHDLKEQMMADFSSLNARIDTLTASVDAAKARIAEDFQALRDQLANDATDQAAVDAAVAKLDESIAALDAVDPDAANPPVEPTPEV